MPTFAELSGWWPAHHDPRADHHKATGKCRHGGSGDNGHAYKVALLKGPHPWQRPHVREQLPKPYKLPYCGSWKAADTQGYWDRSPIPPTMRRAYCAMTAAERSTYLDTITVSAGTFGRPSATLRRHCA